jgi:MFS family permease
MIRTGLLLIAAAFAVVAPLRTLDGPAAAIAFTVLLTLGQMLVPPATRALLTDLADEQRLGLATGALSSLSGLAVVAAGAPIGALLDHDGPPLGSSSPPSRSPASHWYPPPEERHRASGIRGQYGPRPGGTRAQRAGGGNRSDLGPP